MKTEEEEHRTKKAGTKLFHKTLLFRTFDYSYYCLKFIYSFFIFNLVLEPGGGGARH